MTDNRNRSAASKIETPTDKTGEVLEQYGLLSNTFDHARDELISKQLNDEIAKERSSDQGENSWMISKDQPRFINRPPEHIGKPVTRAHFKKQLAEDDKIARARVRFTLEEQELTQSAFNAAANDSHIVGEVSNKEPDGTDRVAHPENWDDLDRIAEDYDLDFETDTFEASNKNKFSQSQS